MKKKKPKADASVSVDLYIARAAPFARPILRRVRRAFHAGCPDIQERIKWGVPSFEKNGIVGGMAAFKSHATFGFWRGADLWDPHRILARTGTASFMTQKLTHVSQLPAHRILVDYVRRAVKLNESRALSRRPEPKPTPRVPADLAAALEKNAKARAAFRAFPPGHRREYVEWIKEAKRPETRARRLATTLDWLAKGKPRRWRYTRR